ncbi:MFS transporter [Micromonospora sp. NBC_00821]|uniref:MFS transporter n=1 Tax=Micromonospora sp. NBC_00821 TaxID=2975977 RepID=UPI002ED3C548|nr:MFS transporter [Micromonospora sp. NBC_00821]
MTGNETTGLRRYAGVVANRQILAALIGALVARLAQTMSPLLILLLANQRYGGFAIAGAAAATYGLCASLSGPLIARLAERYGNLVLLIAGILSSTGLLVIVLPWQSWNFWAGVVLAGAAIPPLSATLRATIATTIEDPQERIAAYGLDTVGTEVLFVLGPALVGLVVALSSPTAALAGTALLPVAGATTLLLQQRRVPSPESSPDAPEQAADRRMLIRLSPWLGVAAVQMAAIGLVEVALIAVAVTFSSSAASGAVLATWAAGSVVGGLWYGARSWRAPVRRQVRLLLLGSAVGFALLLAARSAPALYPLAFLAGVFITPAAAALLTDLSENLTGGHRLTAFAWLASANGLAGSLAYAAGGVLVTGAGPWATIAVAATLPALAALLFRSRGTGPGIPQWTPQSQGPPPVDRAGQRHLEGQLDSEKHGGAPTGEGPDRQSGQSVLR